MTIWKRWIQHGVLCGLLLGGVVGCSTVASPPVGQIAQSDHAALAAWYDNEAAQLRQKANNMAEMKETYKKYPSVAHGAMGGAHKQSIDQHCDNLVALYAKGAEEAAELAQEHRSMK